MLLPGMALMAWGRGQLNSVLQRLQYVLCRYAIALKWPPPPKYLIHIRHPSLWKNFELYILKALPEKLAGDNRLLNSSLQIPVGITSGVTLSLWRLLTSCDRRVKGRVQMC